MSNSRMIVRKQFAETGASIILGSTLEILRNNVALVVEILKNTQKKYCGLLVEGKHYRNTPKY